MRRPGSFARRFIAGESVAEAISAARQIEQQGLMVTLDLLGESVASSDEAALATRAYLDSVAVIERAASAATSR
jgi:proline dehydrogenase